jgi:hypothetical protein
MFTKESGIHKEQAALRNANIELALLCFVPFRLPEGEWEKRVAD